MPSEEFNHGDGHSGATDTTFNRLKNHLMTNKVETALWISRLCTIYCTICYFVVCPYYYYNKCLLSYCITSALRLHQRIPQFRITWEFLALLLAEDSAHYFLYSLIFFFSVSTTMPLIPLFLYSILHVQHFTKQILNLVGPTFMGFLRNLLLKLETNQKSILRLIATIEIFNMPAVVVRLLTGQSYLLLPYLYYRFLCLRYTSRRNPYCKQLFYELRMELERRVVQNPQFPNIIRNGVTKGIALVCRMAPH